MNAIKIIMILLVTFASLSSLAQESGSIDYQRYQRLTNEYSRFYYLLDGMYWGLAPADVNIYQEKFCARKEGECQISTIQNIAADCGKGESFNIDGPRHPAETCMAIEFTSQVDAADFCRRKGFKNVSFDECFGSVRDKYHAHNNESEAYEKIVDRYLYMNQDRSKENKSLSRGLAFAFCERTKSVSSGGEEAIVACTEQFDVIFNTEIRVYLAHTTEQEIAEQSGFTEVRWPRGYFALPESACSEVKRKSQKQQCACVLASDQQGNQGYDGCSWF